MKRLLLGGMLCALWAAGYTQETGKDTLVVVTRDTVESSKKRTKFSFEFGDRQDSTKQDSSTNRKNAFPQFSFGFTFARFDLGLSRYLDDGSFSLSPENEYLEYKGWKTSNVGFEFLQTGVRFSSNFKIYLAAGLDWNHIRLERNITFQKELPLNQFVTDSIQFEKNRFSSRYLRVPLSFEFRSKDDRKGNKIYFVAGPEVGFLLNGKVKQKSNERVKEKFKDDYNFEPFRYGAFARFGYDDLGIYAKYYFNDVFVAGQGPEGLRNLSFGLTVGF